MKYYHSVRGRLFTTTGDNYIYIPYLLLLMFYIVLPLFVEEYSIPTFYNDTLRIVVIVYTLFLPQKIQYMLWIAALLTLGIAVSMFGHPIPSSHYLFPYKQAGLIVFFSILLVVFFKEILYTGINLKMVYQTLACYILLGLIFAIGFRLIHFSSPGAFNFPITEESNHTYLSYIVLTSVGMGDVLPYNSAAKAAVILEGVTGQIYIAFFVSMMVGKYMSHAQARR